jgi:hypothetical protein
MSKDPDRTATVWMTLTVPDDGYFDRLFCRQEEFSIEILDTSEETQNKEI